MSSNSVDEVSVDGQLEYKNLTDADMQHIIDEQIIKKQCTSLNLLGNQITHKGAAMLANALNNNMVQ